MISAAILTIGNELLAGYTVDTNAAFISRALASVGIPVTYKSSVGDDIPQIHDALRLALERCRVIIITGGLGPTDDDVTRDALAAFWKQKLVFYPRTWAKILRQFRTMRRKLPALNRVQAFIPANARLLENEVGNAPGFVVATGTSEVFVVPGVPREMEHLMLDRVLPYCRKKFKLQPIEYRTLHITGIGESALYAKIKELPRPKGLSISYLPSYQGVDVRLSVRTNREKPELRQLEKKISALFAPHIYGYDDDTLAMVLGRMLTKRKLTLSLAESCTGGLIGDMITAVPGSSTYFLLGVTAYSNQAKIAVLGVPEELIQRNGAVSEPVALAMAEGAYQRGGADIGLSVTGTAGPDGGTARKPVGMVCVGLADRQGTRHAFTFYYRGNRQTIKTRAATGALFTLFRHLDDHRARAQRQRCS